MSRAQMTRMKINSKMPEIDIDLISDVVFVLWHAVPRTAVPILLVEDELAAVGGYDRLVRPTVHRWMKILLGRKNRDWTSLVTLKKIITEAYDIAVVSGIMAHAGAAVFEDCTPADWVRSMAREGVGADDIARKHLGRDDCGYAKCPVLEEARRINVRTYMQLLEEKIGEALNCKSLELRRAIMTGNVFMTCLGISLFGLGFGAGMYLRFKHPEKISGVLALQSQSLDEGRKCKE